MIALFAIFLYLLDLSNGDIQQGIFPTVHPNMFYDNLYLYSIDRRKAHAHSRNVIYGAAIDHDASIVQCLHWPLISYRGTQKICYQIL